MKYKIPSPQQRAKAWVHTVGRGAAWPPSVVNASVVESHIAVLETEKDALIAKCERLQHEMDQMRGYAIKGHSNSPTMETRVALLEKAVGLLAQQSALVGAITYGSNL